jgi:hypothetical protein
MKHGFPKYFLTFFAMIFRKGWRCWMKDGWRGIRGERRQVLGWEKGVGTAAESAAVWRWLGLKP